MSLQYLNDKETHPSQRHSSPIVSVCWVPAASSSSQGLILSGDCNGAIKAHDASAALAFADLPQAHKNAVHCLSTNQAGTIALSSAIDGTIMLWDLQPLQNAPYPVHGEELDVEEPRLLPLPVEDPSSLIIGQIDSLPSCPASEALEGLKLSEAWKTVLDPTKPYFASVGAGSVVTLHSTSASAFGKTLSAASLPQDLREQKDLFGLSLAFHPSGSYLAVGTATGQVLLYTLLSSSTPQLKLVMKFADHPAPIRALSFTPHLLLVGSDDRTISVHDIKPILHPSQYSVEAEGDVRMGGTVAKLSGHKGWVLGIAAVEGGIFASVAADRSVKFWDLGGATKNTPVFNTTEMQKVNGFAFQPTAAQGGGEGGEGEAVGSSMTRFVTASEDGRLRWYRGAGLG